MLRLVREHRVRVLLYNEQAVSPITSRVRSAARAEGIPVIGVTETLPAGATFQSWQLGQVRELAAALGP
jgi:zinc/manganese transport system substrate-binding protein